MIPRNSWFAGFLLGMFFLATSGNIGVLAAMPKQQAPDAAYYLKPHLKAGDVLSDLTYRVISTHAPDMDDNVWQVPATGTYTIVNSDSPDVIAWKVSVRMDGKMAIQDAAGDYRDGGKTMCFKGKCNFITDASGPFFNPTFWGNPPEGELKPGMSWTVELTQPWELGPPGKQTVTVLSVDKVNGVVVLKREGHGVGSYEGKHDVAMITQKGKQYSVAVKHGDAHWVGQAVFQHGVVVSDELLCNTAVELSSPEIGTIKAQERQYMSLLQHPGAIEN
jgi:hypothetical protein